MSSGKKEFKDYMQPAESQSKAILRLGAANEDLTIQLNSLQIKLNTSQREFQEQLEQVLFPLQEKTVEQKKNIDDLTQAMLEKTAEIETLLAEITTLQKLKQNASSQGQPDNEALNTELEQLKTENASLKQSLEMATAEHNEHSVLWEKNEENLTQKNKALLDRVNELGKQLETLKQQQALDFSETRNKLDQFEQSNTDRTQYNALNAQYEALRAELSKVTAQSDEYLELIDKLTADKTRLQQENETLKHDHEELTADFKELHARETALNAYVEEWRALGAEWKKSEERLQAIIDDNKNQIQKTKEDLTNLTAKHAQLNLDFEALAAQNQDQEELLSQWAEAEKQWKEQNEQLQTENETLVTLSHEYAAILEEERAAVASLEQSNSMLTGYNQELERQLHEVDYHLHEIENQLGVKHTEYDALSQAHVKLSSDMDALKLENTENLKLVREENAAKEKLKLDHASLRARIVDLEGQLQTLTTTNRELVEKNTISAKADADSTRLIAQQDVAISGLQAQLDLLNGKMQALKTAGEPKDTLIRSLEAQVKDLEQSVLNKEQKLSESEQKYTESQAALKSHFYTNMQRRQTEALQAIRQLKDELPKIRGNEKIAVQEIISCLEQGLREPDAQAYFNSKRVHLKNQLHILQFTSKSLLSTMLNVVLSIVTLCGAGIVLSLSGNLQKNHEKYGSSFAFNLFGIVGAKQRAQGNIQTVANALDVVYRP